MELDSRIINVDSAEFKFDKKSGIQLNSVIGIFTLKSEILSYLLLKLSYRVPNIIHSLENHFLKYD